VCSPTKLGFPGRPASGHLGRLTSAGLLRVETHGRHLAEYFHITWD
jgi:hypothetical protein